jgi:hypothetical protein
MNADEKYNAYDAYLLKNPTDKEGAQRLYDEFLKASEAAQKLKYKGTVLTPETSEGLQLQQQASQYGQQTVQGLSGVPKVASQVGLSIANAIPALGLALSTLRSALATWARFQALAKLQIVPQKEKAQLNLCSVVRGTPPLKLRPKESRWRT